MQQLLDELRELGVYIPEGLDEDALLALAKKLNPWRVTTIPMAEGMYLAYTRKGDTVAAEGEAKAAMFLLLEQLKAGKYTVRDTEYKQMAMAFRKANP